MITLHIDTATVGEALVSINQDGQISEKKSVSLEKRSQAVLPLLDELLREHNLQVTDITNISLETGPGSFTGLRVGAVIAATLSAVLRIPINGLPPGNIPELNYGEDLWGLKKTTTS